MSNVCNLWMMAVETFDKCGGVKNHRSLGTLRFNLARCLHNYLRSKYFTYKSTIVNLPHHLCQPLFVRTLLLLEFSENSLSVVVLDYF